MGRIGKLDLPSIHAWIGAILFDEPTEGERDDGSLGIPYTYFRKEKRPSFHRDSDQGFLGKHAPGSC